MLLRDGAAVDRAFPPLEAGALLVSVTVAALVVGALAGWALGSVGTGLIIGGVVGIPAGIYVVYRRYRDYFR
jgi:F0F1-type ATP synthase assembly protein I